MTKLAAITAGWPLAATLAALVTARGWRAGRRRSAMNEALHELRRPLQAIALAVGQEPAERERLESSVQLAAAALEQLDCEINGGEAPESPELLRMRPVVEAAVARWQRRARLAGDSLVLRWRAGPAVVHGDRVRLSQALDNLIVNAIEHGGTSIVVDSRQRGDRLRVSVVDSGRSSGLDSRRGTPVDAPGRLSGLGARGHGLAVVRRVVAAHDGRFMLRSSEQGALATLELPLAVRSAEPES